MARPALLMRDVETALQVFTAAEVPIVTTALLVSQLNVSLRTAERILKQLGARLEGRMLFLERAVFVDRLRAVQSGEPYQWEAQRQKKLIRVLFEARKYVKSRDVVLRPSAAPGWPPGVRLYRGTQNRLEIDYTDAVDLLTRLTELANHAAQDYPAFQQSVEGCETV